MLVALHVTAIDEELLRLDSISEVHLLDVLGDKRTHVHISFILQHTTSQLDGPGAQSLVLSSIFDPYLPEQIFFTRVLVPLYWTLDVREGLFESLNERSVH